MAALKADRRLAFNADRTVVVEQDDPKAAYLAYPAGSTISDGDVKAYGLKAKDGLVVLSGKEAPEVVVKDVEAPAMKAVEAPTAKDVEAPAEKAVEAPAEKPDKPPKWTLKTSPEAYIERYGKDGPNSDLAHAVIEAKG